MAEQMAAVSFRFFEMADGHFGQMGKGWLFDSNENRSFSHLSEVTSQASPFLRVTARHKISLMIRLQTQTPREGGLAHGARLPSNALTGQSSAALLQRTKKERGQGNSSVW